MVEQVAEYIRQWNMIEAGDCVLVGVSGGADSICLCCVLEELAGRMDFSLRVVHVEHGIRGEESAADARFVADFCEAHGLPYVVCAVDVPAYAREHKIGEEEAARLLRYEAFRAEAAQYPGSRIALAHHMEDNAETMLFQMARGSGLDGMCGIRPVRTDTDGMTYIRPLLGVSREKIEQELARRNQVYCTDATNADLDYSRNRIRHTILPSLREVNTQAVAHLNRMAQQMDELREYLDMQVKEAWGSVVAPEAADVVLQVEALQQLPKILQTRLVHQAIAQAAGARKDLEAAHVEAVLTLLSRQSGRSVDLPYHLIAERSFDTIHIRRQKEMEPAKEQECRITEELLRELVASEEAVTLVADGMDGRFRARIFQFDGNLSEIPQKMYTKWFDYDKIKFGFSIRTRRNQDYFVMDDAGHRKKLSDYFIDRKVPVKERDTTFLVADGSRILWIVGGRMGRSAQLEGTSRMVLELTYEGGTRDGLQ